MIVTSLTDYTAKATNIFLEKVLMGPSITQFTVQSGIKYKEYINYLDIDITLQSGWCELSGNTSGTLTEREIQVYSVGIKDKICETTLDAKALTNEDLAAVLTDKYTTKIAKKVDDDLWGGTISGGDYWNGFNYWLSNSATSLSTTATTTSANVDDQILSLITAAAAVENLWAQEDKTIYTTLANFHLYKVNRIAATAGQFLNADFPTDNTMWVYGYEGLVKLQGIPGLVGTASTSEFYLTFPKNLVVGMDEVSQISSFKYVYDEPNNVIYPMAKFKLGTQIIYPTAAISLR